LSWKTYAEKLSTKNDLTNLSNQINASKDARTAGMAVWGPRWGKNSKIARKRISIRVESTRPPSLGTGRGGRRANEKKKMAARRARKKSV